MAQKQFKIGLSNTDKQNMAQDVYERVLALTFNEYDTTTEYDVGDFVVYNDQLYKCIGDTSGAWDSTKWQLATLNDLLTDIESAVAFVNDKANVDGNYPTMTVGAADNLTPYDEESGTDQEQPFLLQGTGCGNGEQQVDTGALGLLKEKQGHSVVVNQKVDTNSLDTSYTINAGDYKDICTPFLDGYHKIILIVKLNVVSGDVTKARVNIIGRTAQGVYAESGERVLENNNPVIFTSELANYDSSGLIVRIANYDTDTAFSYQNLECYLIDLTQWFGSNDNIPAHLLSHPEDFFRYYQGSLAYNEGTLVNSNGRYIKCIGRNQCDEVFEGGYISDSDGQNAALAGAFRTKNYQRVIPNETYHLHVASSLGGQAFALFQYDKDKNFIKSYANYSADSNFTLEPNTCYVRIGFYKESSGWESNPPSKETAQVTFSIYYEGESGYDQYYPYEELANIDTGTEVLRSAGNVKDSKAPDGTITRRVGVVDLGECSFSAGGDTHTFMLRLDDMNDSFGRYNFICAKFDNVGEAAYALYTDKGNLKVAKESGGHRLYFSYEDASTPADFKTAMNGVYLFYELAEPTTEQGTTFSENVAIDDFGSMDFGGTNGVPQGASIFYAVDYKAFIDSLYNTLDGDATDIVKESELDTKLATLGYVKLTSVSGYDATKTQVLKNVEGTLTWVTEE